jgi:Fe2+ or Zn2+ uptake regulation protein
MSCASDYAPQLRARGYRVTSQRMAILHALRHSGRHLSPRDVYTQAKKEYPSLTEPTVYRTLEFLAENGLVILAQAGRGHLAYEIAGEDHHHLVCRVCGSEITVEHHLVENLYRTLEAASQYSHIGSHLTFSGICPDCQQA